MTWTAVQRLPMKMNTSCKLNAVLASASNQSLKRQHSLLGSQEDALNGHGYASAGYDYLLGGYLLFTGT